MPFRLWDDDGEVNYPGRKKTSRMGRKWGCVDEKWGRREGEVEGREGGEG